MTLVAFDFDGTLSDSEMTVLLGKQNATADLMDDITSRAMNDEIEYGESLRQRCTLLEGLPVEDARAAFDQVALRPGSADVVRELDSAGVYTAVVTGGFQRGVEAALETEGVQVDTIVANRLPVDGAALSGGVEGPLIEGTKDDALADLADAQSVAMEETVAVGDGANDLPMLKVAGRAIGFKPKEAVVPACDVTVESMPELRDLFVEEGVL